MQYINTSLKNLCTYGTNAGWWIMLSLSWTECSWHDSRNSLHKCTIHSLTYMQLGLNVLHMVNILIATQTVVKLDSAWTANLERWKRSVGYGRLSLEKARFLHRASHKSNTMLLKECVSCRSRWDWLCNRETIINMLRNVSIVHLASFQAPMLQTGEPGSEVWITNCRAP